VNREFHATAAGNKPRFDFSAREYLELTELLQNRFGLVFQKEKQKDVEMRLSMSEMDKSIETPRQLIDAVNDSDTVLQDLVNYLTIGESYFFRNRPHFDALREKILPQIIEEASERKVLRIWCAGCATGEEPYSLSILLKEHFPRVQNWDVSIVATDINTRFLERARRGVYRNWSFRGVDRELIDRNFDMDETGRYVLHDDLKKRVEFSRFNIAKMLGGGRPPKSFFDMILCRNVLIYFPFQQGDQIVSEFSKCLRPGGYLLVGHSEAFPSLGKLNVVYSNATYYYRLRRPDEKTDASPAPVSAWSIPGIGVGSIVSSLKAPFLPGDKAPDENDIEDSSRRSRISPITGPIDIHELSNVPTDTALEHARQLADAGYSKEALEVLETVAQKAGRLDHRVHFLRAIVVDQAGRAREAIKCLKQAIFLNKSFVLAHYYLGVIHQRDGDNHVAERYFRNVRRLLALVDDDYSLEQAAGVTVSRLKEIVTGRTKEVGL
jgi:chemotaxis protein methyltransferase CheR